MSEQTENKTLKAKLGVLESHQIVSLIDKCASYIKELKLTANPKLWLDVAVLDMSNLTQNTKLEDLQRRISMLESGEGVKVVHTSPYNTPPSPVKKTEVMKPIKPEVKPVAQQEENVVDVPKSLPSEDEVLTDSVPMSKPATPNALKGSWAKLLENISSFPSRAILKQQAVPVIITEDQIVLTIKNPSWLKQFAPDGSKHSSIVEAVNKMYQNGAKKIIVRAPESGDEAIRKEQASNSDDESPAPAPKTVKQSEPVSQKVQVLEAVNAKEEADFEVENLEVETESPISRKNSGNGYHSDNVNMVMDLFEGKFIE